MAKSNTNQILVIAGLGAAGYFVYKKLNPSVSDQIINPATGAPVDSSVLPTGQTVLAPPTAPLQTYTGAVPTPYGPVIPSNFNNTQGVTPNSQTQAIKDRMADIIFRHQYIFNSVAYGLQYKQSGQADPGIDGRIATLRGKDEILQTEWGTYTGGQRIPDGTINTPEKKAAYIAFLRAHSWCDPLVGVPC